MAERFPPPWTMKGNANCYWIVAANGVRVAYVYFSDDRSGHSQLHLVSRDSARRLANNIAKLPELVRLRNQR
ncbi:hypothetical protein [Novosphingobium sp. Gsoil 351]|uniref:hypothetical protein n=1 Tax=Novosphingobium sp. Gsoil 351 TaxID=2675225 RepID=UPI0018A87A87|nr:hypothetical protein [Novosphingobium sp. Gsoil 351]